MKLLVLAKNRDEFAEFRRWQIKPEECIYVDNEVTFLSNPKTMVILLPMWYHNQEYARIRNIKPLMDKAMKGAKYEQ